MRHATAVLATLALVLMLTPTALGAVPSSAPAPSTAHPFISSPQPLQGRLTDVVQDVCNHQYLRSSMSPDICLIAAVIAGVPGATITVCGGGSYNCANSTNSTVTNAAGYWYMNYTNTSGFSSYFVQWGLQSVLPGSFNYTAGILSACGYTPSTAGQYLTEHFGNHFGPTYMACGGSSPGPVQATFTNFVHQHLEFINSTSGKPVPNQGVSFSGFGICWYDNISCSTFQAPLTEAGGGIGVVQPLGATWTFGFCMTGYFCSGNQTFHAVSNTTYNISANPYVAHAGGALYPKMMSGTVDGWSSTANGMQLLPLPYVNVSLNATSYRPNEFSNYVNLTVHSHNQSGAMVLSFNVANQSALGLALQNTRGGAAGVAFFNTTWQTLLPATTNCAARLHFWETPLFVPGDYTYFVSFNGTANNSRQQVTMFFGQNATDTACANVVSDPLSVFSAYEDFGNITTGNVSISTSLPTAYNNGTITAATLLNGGWHGGGFVASPNGTNGNQTSGAAVVSVMGPSGMLVKALEITGTSYFLTLPQVTLGPKGRDLAYYAIVRNSAGATAAVGAGNLSVSAPQTMFTGFTTTALSAYGAERSTVPGFINGTIGNSSNITEQSAAYGIAPGQNSWSVIAFNIARKSGEVSAWWNSSIGTSGTTIPTAGIALANPGDYPMVGGVDGAGATTDILAVYGYPFTVVQPSVTIGIYQNTTPTTPETVTTWVQADASGKYTLTVNASTSAYYSLALFAFVGTGGECNATRANIPVSFLAPGNSTTFQNFVLPSCWSVGVNYTLQNAGGAVANAAVNINGVYVPNYGGWSRWIAAPNAKMIVSVAGNALLTNYTEVAAGVHALSPVTVAASPILGGPGGCGLACAGGGAKLYVPLHLFLNTKGMPGNMTKAPNPSLSPVMWAIPLPGPASCIGCPPLPIPPPWLMPVLLGVHSGSVRVPFGYLSRPLYLVRTNPTAPPGFQSPCPAPFGGPNGDLKDCVVAVPVMQFASSPGIQVNWLLHDSIVIVASGNAVRTVNILGPHSPSLPPLHLFYPGLTLGKTYTFTITNTTTRTVVSATAFVPGSSNTAKGVSTIIFTNYAEDAAFAVRQQPVASATNEVFGYVRSSGSGHALVGATVNLVGGIHNYDLFTSTNGGGFYSFNVSNSHYNVTASVPNYHSSTAPIYVNNAPVEQNFSLVQVTSPGALTLYGGLSLTDWLIVGGVVAAAVVVGIVLYTYRGRLPTMGGKRHRPS